MRFPNYILIDPDSSSTCFSEFQRLTSKFSPYINLPPQNFTHMSPVTLRTRKVMRFLLFPNEKEANEKILKVFHFGRFDIAVLLKTFGILTGPVYCTKIASKLIRTYTDRHGLKNLLQELLDTDISKQQQSSDWGSETLTDAQLEYAASDVLYLHSLKKELDLRLKREGRFDLAKSCFDFLPTRAMLDLAGWPETDIFAH